jgi:hypothetical protein
MQLIWQSRPTLQRHCASLLAQLCHLEPAGAKLMQLPAPTDLNVIDWKQVATMAVCCCHAMPAVIHWNISRVVHLATDAHPE